MDIKIKTGLNIGSMESIIAKKNKIPLIAAAVSSIVLLIPGIIFFVLFYNIISIRISSLLMIILGIILVPITYILTPIIQKQLRNFVMKKENGAEIIYELTKNEITQHVTRNNGAIETKKYKYSLLHSVEEKSGEFVIYINSMSVFILPKNDFIQGSPEELSGFLKKEFGSKYKKTG